MRLSSKQKQIVWKKARRMAFWDQPNYEYRQWRQAILRGDTRTLVQSIQYMKPIDFIRLVDINDFVDHWGEWRSLSSYKKSGDKKMQINCILLDALWGDYVMDNALVIPNNEFLSLTRKQKETYNLVTQYAAPLSMYELAKSAKRHYRRVFDDINALVQKQLFKKERVKRNNRTVDLIYPVIA